MKNLIILTAGLGLMSGAAFAGEVGETTTFESGTPALAAEVNANFGALISAINDNAQRIAALEGAAPSSSVAGATYKLVSLGTYLANDDDTLNDGNNSATFANIGSISVVGSASFDSAGGGTLTIDAEDEYEINVPSNQLTDFSLTSPEVLNFTYTQDGSTVNLNVTEGDGEVFPLSLVVTPDGNVGIARLVETGPTDFNDGSTGHEAFVELVFAIKQ